MVKERDGTNMKCRERFHITVAKGFLLSSFQIGREARSKGERIGRSREGKEGQNKEDGLGYEARRPDEMLSLFLGFGAGALTRNSLTIINQ